MRIFCGGRRDLPNRLNEFPGLSDKVINQCYPFKFGLRGQLQLSRPNAPSSLLQLLTPLCLVSGDFSSVWMLPMFTEVGEGGGVMGNHAAVIDCNSQADFLYATHASLAAAEAITDVRVHVQCLQI